jgi:lysyl-tRNA synthetase class 2
MDDTNALIEQRKAKLAALRGKGIDPFKNKFVPSEKCAEARANYVEGREVSVAGRVTAHRDMGKSLFIDVRDQSGRLQVYAQKNVLGDEQFDIFRHLDLGDFVGAKGTLFTTRTGEVSIRLTSPVKYSSTRRGCLGRLTRMARRMANRSISSARYPASSCTSRKAEARSARCSCIST